MNCYLSMAGGLGAAVERGGGQQGQAVRAQSVNKNLQ